MRKRGAEFWNEFELYLSDLFIGLVLDVVLVRPSLSNEHACLTHLIITFPTLKVGLMAPAMILSGAAAAAKTTGGSCLHQLAFYLGPFSRASQSFDLIHLSRGCTTFLLTVLDPTL